MTVNHVQNIPLVWNQQSGIHAVHTEVGAQQPVPTSRHFGGSSFSLRRPRFGDFAGWRAARISNESFLAPAFGEASRSWQDLNTPAAWVEKYLTDRRLARRGRSRPHFLIETKPDHSSHVAGEVSICRVDELSNAGELSVWCTPSTHQSEVTGWAGHSVVLQAFTGSRPLRWILAPVAEGNPRPAKGLAFAGFEKSATFRCQRTYAGTPADHDLWVLENTDNSRKRLRELMELS